MGRAGIELSSEALHLRQNLAPERFSVSQDEQITAALWLGRTLILPMWKRLALPAPQYRSISISRSSLMPK